ncbi:MAG: NmrA family NAD(P)-binding protein [Chloroflexota bacterium]|nr:NmrA family NAD(P)-binding protein [Chloroflexota bacterium]
MTEGRNGTVLVYGATGAQSGPVARRLLEAGHGVRVLTRDATKATALRDRGADVVEGDMSDPAAMRAATEGVDKVFLLVPFFVRDPADTVRYGRNAIEAARAAGVRLVVWNPSGEIVPVQTGNPSLDARSELLGLLQASGLPHIVLQPTAYMENFLGP